MGSAGFRRNGRTDGSRLLRLQRTDKAISPAWQGFNKTGTAGVFAEGFPQPGDGVVQAVIEVDESVGGPQPVAQLIPGDDLAGLFQKNHQYLKRKALNRELDATFAQFRGAEVQFKHAEAHD